MRQVLKIFTFCNSCCSSFKEANEAAGALKVDNDIIGVKADLFQKMWNWRIFMRHYFLVICFGAMPRILFDNKALIVL